MMITKIGWALVIALYVAWERLRDARDEKKAIETSTSFEVLEKWYNELHEGSYYEAITCRTEWVDKGWVQIEHYYGLPTIVRTPFGIKKVNKP